MFDLEAYGLERLRIAKEGEPTNTFTHAGTEYDLNKVRIALRSEKAFLLPIKDLLWVLHYDTPDEDRVYHAKFRYPLIVARWNNRWTVVDGLHRLERYRRKGISIIPVKEANAEILRNARIQS